VPSLTRIVVATVGVCFFLLATSASAEKVLLEDCDPHPTRFWFLDAKGAAELLRYTQKQKECEERNEIRNRLKDDPEMVRNLEAVWEDVFAENFDEDSRLDREFQEQTEKTIRDAINQSKKKRGPKNAQEAKSSASAVNRPQDEPPI